MNLNLDTKTCVICEGTYLQDVAGVLRCSQCGLLYSMQKAGFGNPIMGMGSIAARNYAIVAEALEKVTPLQGKKILDVGSAEGGFTELVLQKQGDCLGLEPDKDAAQEALAKKLPVELVSFEGFPGEKKEYDAIVFNDVFEHMQSPVVSLEKSCQFLKDDGVILFNIPVSTGFIFRMVRLAARLGVASTYQRMWARGLSSPHIYFYNEENLKILLKKYQFELVDKGRLIALSTDGMYKRVRSTYGPVPALIISTIASVFAMISNMFPADVKYFLFKKKTPR